MATTPLNRIAYMHKLLEAAAKSIAQLGFTETEIVDAFQVYSIEWVTNHVGSQRAAEHFAGVAERIAAKASTANLIN